MPAFTEVAKAGSFIHFSLQVRYPEITHHKNMTRGDTVEFTRK